MPVQNIQIGIDLGTTNSEIAIYQNGEFKVIKNISGDEYTPSVFGIDKAQNKVVGKKAYEKLFKDASDDDVVNYKAEIKRVIGSSEKIFFPRVNKSFSPEEISGEILKSLKSDVLRNYPEFPVYGAVITTPASFETTQAEATKRAGNLAGFDYVVLLQEPIAAAFAYGFSNSDDVNILVYDLGGGTFDSALISSRGGVLSVLSHNGDNFLGGKDIDKLIVREILVPELKRKFQLNNFEEGNKQYKTAFAQLKYAAETAKIELSQYPKTTVEIQNIGKDDRGEEIYLIIDINRSRFEQLISPLIDKTIDLSKKTIDDAGISPSSIKKLVLVGGPTQIPFVRSKLKEGLNIEIDSSIDPLTVVAKGASIFAASQQIPQEILNKGKTVAPGTKHVQLNFSSLTSDLDETITGVIEDLKKTEESYYIQIQGENKLFTSEKIRLKKGAFICTVALEPKKDNLFWIYLFDDSGNTIATDPDFFSIKNGVTIAGAPIPHSIGVALAKKDIRTDFTFRDVFDVIFEKGSILPLKSDPKIYHTTKAIKKGEDADLAIKVFEGESEIPDRNSFICDIKLKGSEIPYDLPINSEVQLTVNVDESRVLTVDAYFPLVDISMSARAPISDEIPDVQKMIGELNTEIERFSKIEENCTSDEKIKMHYIFSSTKDDLKHADYDDDAKRKAAKEVKDLKILLDDLEKEKEFPALVKEYQTLLTQIGEMNKDIGLDDQKERNSERLSALKIEGDKAVADNDKILLIRINEQLYELGHRIYWANPGAWVHKFNQIAESKPRFLDEKEANYYLEKGQTAIQNGDLSTLQSCVMKLADLIPPEEQKILVADFSGITH